ncbi:MAG: response regulator, partial [Candidatus Electrothrix sp. AR3]|nr:response regulator [Candidatus Electrothrix sp. AR3]
IQILHFEVEDTGIGISPEYLEKIFEPFIQAANSVDKAASTGLGLTISRQFIHLMGGKLEVESTINSGSLFRFKIAVDKAENPKIEEPSHWRGVIGLAPDQSSFRILVIEDILESRKLLVKILKSVGFEVQEAADGKQGLDIFHSWLPDLIWMDMRMPVLDGYEATKQIKQTEQGKKTIIIALTAHAFDDEKEKILNIGCDDFLSKPYVAEELFAAMEKHLGVEFLYEKRQNIIPNSLYNCKLTVKGLAELPKEIKKDFLEASAELDQEGCFAILEKLDLSHQELASLLRILVENYRFEDIENIFNKENFLSKVTMAR